MNVMMIRAKIKEENVADTQAATENVIQALERAHPDVHYAVTRLSDGVTVLASWRSSPVRSTRCSRFPSTRRCWKTSRAGTRSRRLWST
jgi:hypothetical protein